MKGSLVDKLAAREPLVKSRMTLQQLWDTGELQGALYVDVSSRFINSYATPHYGWVAAQKFANARQPIPVILEGRDAWVFKAFLFALDRHKYFNRHIAEALAMWQGSRQTGGRRPSHVPGNAVNSMLLICATRQSDVPAERHFAGISAKTGISAQTIAAYEQLFYNVIDRFDEHYYLSSDVYPGSRLETLREDYMEQTAVGDLLKRLGYDWGDLDMTAWAAGLGDRNFAARVTAAEGNEAELTRMLVANGILLSRTGALNSRNVGVSRATGLLAAARQAGSNNEEPLMSDLFPAFSQGLLGAMQSSAAVKREMMVSKDS